MATIWPSANGAAAVVLLLCGCTGDASEKPAEEEESEASSTTLSTMPSGTVTAAPPEGSWANEECLVVSVAVYETSGRHGAETMYVSRHGYNRAGSQLTWSLGSSLSGPFTLADQRTYNDRGEIVVHDSLPDGEGTFRDRSTFTYDGHGNQLGEEHEGDFYGRYSYAYTYDADNRLLTETYLEGEERSSVDYEETWTYDASGNVSSWDYDQSADGVLEGRILYDWDAGGNLLSTSYDYAGDGSVDMTEVSRYEARGNRVAYAEWHGAVLDFAYSFRYDEAGKKSQQIYDGDGDGTWDGEAKYRYDAFGQLVEEARDSDLDGVVDSTTRYSYDVDGNLLMMALDRDGDASTPAERYLSRYDVDGNLVYYEDYRERSAWTYDSRGNLLVFWTDTMYEGRSREGYTYDEGNNVRSYALDDDADGTVDYASDYFYSRGC